MPLQRPDIRGPEWRSIWARRGDGCACWASTLWPRAIGRYMNHAVERSFCQLPNGEVPRCNASVTAEAHAGADGGRHARRHGTQTIVAVTSEDDRFARVRCRATALAAGGQGTVILYDLDAGGLFASPVPTEWSGEGEQELLDEEAGPRDRLDPDELDTAGRGAVADQVRRCARWASTRGPGSRPSGRRGPRRHTRAPGRVARPGARRLAAVSAGGRSGARRPVREGRSLVFEPMSRREPAIGRVSSWARRRRRQITDPSRSGDPRCLVPPARPAARRRDLALVACSGGPAPAGPPGPSTARTPPGGRPGDVRGARRQDLPLDRQDRGHPRRGAAPSPWRSLATGSASSAGCNQANGAYTITDGVVNLG